MHRTSIATSAQPGVRIEHAHASREIEHAGMSGLALSLVANASGTVNVKTTPLITIEEIDAA
jgi:hypothetical protein